MGVIINMRFSVRWVFGEMGRKIEAYTVTASGLMAMSLLAFVSIERYLRYDKYHAIPKYPKSSDLNSLSTVKCSSYQISPRVYQKNPFQYKFDCLRGSQTMLLGNETFMTS